MSDQFPLSQVEEQVHQRTKELQTLFELTQKIGYTIDYLELFHTIQTSLNQVLDFDMSASLVADDPSTGRFEGALTFYLPQPLHPSMKEIAQQRLLNTFTRLLRRPVGELRVVELHGVNYNPERAPLTAEMQSFFNVPLIVDGETIGLLHVASQRPNAFSENQLSLLYKAANQASTAVQKLQALLTREQAHLEAIVDGLGEGVILLDQQGRVRLVNPAAVKLIELLDCQVPQVGKRLSCREKLPIDEIFSKTVLPQPVSRLAKIVGEDPGPFVEIWVAGPKVLDEQMLLIVLRDVTEQRHHEAILVELSNTDALSGLANRRRFFDALQIEISRARRYNGSLALIMMDLDHLKDINDRFGHQAGDEAIRVIGRILRQECRQADLPARYGGDEFAIILPETNTSGAGRVARRLLNCAAQIRLPDGAALSISLGAAELVSFDDEFGDSLVGRADQALYNAKEDGRGCLRTIPELGLETNE